jgi:hypothetical protein
VRIIGVAFDDSDFRATALRVPTDDSGSILVYAPASSGETHAVSFLFSVFLALSLAIADLNGRRSSRSARRVPLL